MKVAVKTNLIIVWILSIFVAAVNLMQMFSKEWNITAAVVTLFSIAVVIVSGKALALVQKESEHKAKLLNLLIADGLTGLLNRRTAEEKIIEYLEAEARPTAMYMIDIDRFKNINDEYGHLAGDEVLRGMADVLLKVFGAEYIVSRWGGDEFVVFMQYIPREGFVEKKAHELCKAVGSAKFTKNEINVTVSVGVQLVESTTEFETIYNGADKALYRAKEKGRNGYIINKR